MKIKFPANLETHQLLVDIANHILFEDEPSDLLEIVEKAIVVSPFERKLQKDDENAKEEAQAEEVKEEPKRSRKEVVS